MNEELSATEKALREKLGLELPPDTFERRWRNADKLHLLQHAQRLEEQMRVLAALLEGRDFGAAGGPTLTSVRAIAEAKRLARLEP